MLKNSEIAILKLRSLYESRGYTHFKMSKFEEYDIYAANKDFLGGESIVTFTDANGRLMALKPDVTMSIIKNTKDGDGLTEKLYYNENVYRVSKGYLGLREIMQSGLECIGDIDLYNTCEVISLAAKSLCIFERECILDISHMGIVSYLIDELSVPDDIKKQLIKCIAEKNIHGIRSILSENGSKNETLVELVSLEGNAEESFEELKKIFGARPRHQALSELESVIKILTAGESLAKIRLDFSVVQDMSYYNGIVFQGFINGIPEKVLSGGRYDLLMKRIGKSKSAIGFGVNVDLLEDIFECSSEFDADIALIYSDSDDTAKVFKLADELSNGEKSVRVTKKLPQRAKYKQVIKFCEHNQ